MGFVDLRSEVSQGGCKLTMLTFIHGARRWGFALLAVGCTTICSRAVAVGEKTSSAFEDREDNFLSFVVCSGDSVYVLVCFVEEKSVIAFCECVELLAVPSHSSQLAFHSSTHLEADSVVLPALKLHKMCLLEETQVMASEVPGRKLEADSESSPELKPKPAGLSRVRVYSYVAWITPTFRLFQVVSSLDVFLFR